MAEASAPQPSDPALFEALRAWRRDMAAEKSVPPYIIAHDKTLDAIAAAKPTTEKELLQIPGMGGKKVEQYGKDMLLVIKNHVL